MKISDIAPEERPIERLISKGANALTNTELLAILLKSGTTRSSVLEVAAEVLHEAEGSLVVLSSYSVEKLTDIVGVGTMKAATIVAAFELGRRFSSENSGNRRLPIGSARMVYDLVGPLMKGLTHEECRVLYLNNAGYLVNMETMSSGGFDETVLDSKMIIGRVLEKKATRVIIVHNHPSGSPEPSTSDASLTRNMREALSKFRITLMDHVIISDDSYFSFAENRTFSVAEA